MSETTTVSVPAAEAAPELTLEQQLEALAPTKETVAPATESASTTPVATDTKPAEGASPSPALSPDDPLKALESIEEPTAEKAPEAPKLSAEQQQIFDTIKTPQEAQQLRGIAQNYGNFTQAFESGNFDGVEQMFQAWNPAAYDAFLEHVYTKKVANNEWVDRWIAEKEGNGTQHTALGNLQKQIQQLQAQLNGRSQQEQQQRSQEQSQAQRQQFVVAYNTHLNGLFDKINFSPADRRWVASDISQRLSQDPNALIAAEKGNLSAINGVFKSAVRDYVTRDQQQAKATQGKIDTQNQKKSPLQSSSVATESVLPDNIKDVPKGQEDSWMDQQFSKLFASVKGKR